MRTGIITVFIQSRAQVQSIVSSSHESQFLSKLYQPFQLQQSPLPLLPSYHPFILSNNERERYHSFSNMRLSHSTSSSSGALSTSSASSSPSPVEIEVEQKFSVSTSNLIEMEARLSSLGFCPLNSVPDKNESESDVKRFTDWYYDTTEPLWVLTTRDCWLRYRQSMDTETITTSKDSGDDKVVLKMENKSRGVWQLKRGLTLSTEDGDDNPSHTSTTVYEELQGDKAIKAVLSILIEATTDNVDDTAMNMDTDVSNENEVQNDTFAPHVIPTFPSSDCSHGALVPFARIETTRSSWVWKDNRGDDSATKYTTNNRYESNPSVSKANLFDDLKVDIDKTDFGYVVGEVEGIVNDKKLVDDMKNRIEELVIQLTGKSVVGRTEDDGVKLSHKSPSTPTQGKLETYLIQKNKKHYDACVRAGSM